MLCSAQSLNWDKDAEDLPADWRAGITCNVMGPRYTVIALDATAHSRDVEHHQNRGTKPVPRRLLVVWAVWSIRSCRMESFDPAAPIVQAIVVQSLLSRFDCLGTGHPGRGH